MRAALAACLLLVPAAAEAFLFGGASEKKAAERLASLRAAYAGGDCAAVRAQAEPFLGEKPYRKMREEAYGYIGACYERDGLYDKAVSHYKVALELFPDNALFALRLGAIYNSAGFFAQAAPLFERAAEKDPAGAEAALGLARAWYGLGFLGRAKESYARAAALAKEPGAALLREYAACLLKQRDWDGVDSLAVKGEAAEPGAAFWPKIRARALAGRGRYEEAAAAMTAAGRLEPSPQARLERALYLLLGGSPGKAAAAADAELSAGGPLAGAVKALALYSEGREEEARPLFAAAAGAGDTFTGRLAAAFLEAMEKEGGPCKR